MCGRLIRKHHSQPQSSGCLTDTTIRIQRLIVSSAVGTAPLSAGVTEERLGAPLERGAQSVIKSVPERLNTQCAMVTTECFVYGVDQMAGADDVALP